MALRYFVAFAFFGGIDVPGNILGCMSTAEKFKIASLAMQDGESVQMADFIFDQVKDQIKSKVTDSLGI